MSSIPGESVLGDVIDEAVLSESTSGESVLGDVIDEAVPSEPKLASEYKILHPVLFTYTVQEAVAFDVDENTYWIEKTPKPKDAPRGYEEVYRFYPMTEELYEEFSKLRKDFCDVSGEPFYQGDPLIVKAVDVAVSKNVFVGRAEHRWNFSPEYLRRSAAITVPASLISNLDVPLKVIHQGLSS